MATITTRAAGHVIRAVQTAEGWETTIDSHVPDAERERELLTTYHSARPTEGLFAATYTALDFPVLEAYVTA
jgi:hypothetical protein